MGERPAACACTWFYEGCNHTPDGLKACRCICLPQRRLSQAGVIECSYEALPDLKKDAYRSPTLRAAQLDKHFALVQGWVNEKRLRVEAEIAVFVFAYQSFHVVAARADRISPVFLSTEMPKPASLMGAPYSPMTSMVSLRPR